MRTSFFVVLAHDFHSALFTCSFKPGSSPEKAQLILAASLPLVEEQALERFLRSPSSPSYPHFLITFLMHRSRYADAYKMLQDSSVSSLRTTPQVAELHSALRTYVESLLTPAEREMTGGALSHSFNPYPAPLSHSSRQLANSLSAGNIVDDGPHRTVDASGDDIEDIEDDLDPASQELDDGQASFPSTSAPIPGTPSRVTELSSSRPPHHTSPFQKSVDSRRRRMSGIRPLQLEGPPLLARQPATSSTLTSRFSAHIGAAGTPSKPSLYPSVDQSPLPRPSASPAFYPSARELEKELDKKEEEVPDVNLTYGLEEDEGEDYEAMIIDSPFVLSTVRELSLCPLTLTSPDSSSCCRTPACVEPDLYSPSSHSPFPVLSSSA